MRLRKSILIFLIDGTQCYEEGVKAEFGDDKGVKILIFATFDECSKYLFKVPDIIMMDEPEESVVKYQLKLKVDNLNFKSKLIFISKANGHEEMISSSVSQDDYILEDDSLFEKIKIAVEEFAFTKDYNEDYDTDILTVDNSFGAKSVLFIPIAIGIVAFVLIMIIYLA